MGITIRFLVDSCINKYSEAKAIDLCMETAIYLRGHPEETKEVVRYIIEVLNGRCPYKALDALRLADICFINGSYPFQKEICSSKMVAAMNRWIPRMAKTLTKKLISISNGPEQIKPLLYDPSNTVDSLDIKMKVTWAILGMVSKWYLGYVKYVIKEQRRVPGLSMYYLNFLYLAKFYTDLLSKGYVFPIIKIDEIKIITPFIAKLFLSPEDWYREVSEMQNYRLKELTISPKTSIMANKIVQDITLYEEDNYWRYENYIQRCFNTVGYHLKLIERQRDVSKDICGTIAGWHLALNRLIDTGKIPNSIDKEQIIMRCRQILNILKVSGNHVEIYNKAIPDLVDMSN